MHPEKEYSSQKKTLLIMKKESVKKLSLGKITIANLNNTRQAKQHAKPTYTGCSLFRCPPPPNEN
jgi:hypothetical protein